jgi:hypothetical protein
MAKSSLAPREKKLIGFMFTVMLCMTLIPIYKNVSTRHAQSENQLAQAIQRLDDTRIWRSAIVSDREGQKIIQAQLSARGGSFDLYGATSKWISDTKLDGRANLQSKGLTSREGAIEGIQITLAHVNMNEILDLLHKMYNSKNMITMQKMPYLRPSRDGKGLECAIVMIAPKR